jgi:hypothetical protein
MTGRAALRFWLLWTLASSIGSGVAFAIALYPAGILGWVVGLPIGAAVVGLSIGLVVGWVQSRLLPWPNKAKRRWFSRSVLGWTLGNVLGCLVALGAESWRHARGESEGILSSSSLLLETAAPISGLVLGLALRSVPPHRAAPWEWWPAAYIVAVSGGWIVGRMLAMRADIVGLTLPALILGPLWYGTLSGLAMLAVLRDQSPAPAEDAMDTEVA